MKVISLLALSILSIAASAAIASEGGNTTGGVPNPAAVICLEKGGQSEMYTSERGSSDYFCRFDRAIIGEWTLWYALKDRENIQIAVDMFLKHPNRDVNIGNGGANPASLYCKKVGGRTEYYEGRNGTMGVCTFPDKSEIEEWTLYVGPSVEGNGKLADVLGEK